MLVSCQARKWRFGHRVIPDRIPSQAGAELRHGYDPCHVDCCRKRVNSLLGKYRKLEKAAAGIDGFEADRFAHMVLALENYFCRRLRCKQGKDENPLNEVRLITNAIMTDPVPSRPTGADMSARSRVDCRLRHDGLIFCVHRNAGVVINAPGFPANGPKCRPQAPPYGF